MTPPEQRRGSLLGAAAYLLVPGDRRRKAAGHFRKAGFEAVRGFGALAKPEKTSQEQETSRRERIEID